MKKIYSLFATVMVVSGFFAQTVFSATFDDVSGTGGNSGGWSGSAANAGYTDGNTSYTTGGAWDFSKVYKGDQCIKVGTGNSKGSVKTPSFTLTGNATLTFRAGAWSGSSESTTLKISATGATLSQATVTMVKGSFSDYTVNITDATGDVTLTFEGNVASNNRFFLDDIVVTSAAVLGVSDFASAAKGNFVKNTFVKTNEITFGSDVKDVKIYNMSGQIVKSASVKSGASVNVAELAKGNYIVTGTVNNQSVSQRILKD
ncbi:T9SS type A sorting domain-containing protein [Chryseobacterium sp. MYb264]|uniref:T9SS type A sorting domain-containing protein n=1 Tax=Chryseobacterium sp. MYb264 TaxID=2745153 RepID=UPI002E110761|nr:T9SS type A sorting domain-containing protein [Chryseobacterium sp. MYb264]